MSSLSSASDEFVVTCRACLENKGITDIFLTIYADFTLCDLYSTISLLELDEADGLPRMLCSNCTDFVIKFNAFRKRAQVSETYLKNSLLNHLKEDEFKALTHQLSDNDDLSESNELSNDEIRTESDTEKSSTRKKIPRRIPNDLTCTFCDLKFDTYSAYLIHRKKEADKRRRKKPCTICHKLISSYKLKDHLNSHTKERPYECQTCGETFRFKSSLGRHKFLHMEKKPHECHICGRGFIQAPTLTDHIRTHYGEKSCMCNICGKGFVTKHALGNHINMHKMDDKKRIKDSTYKKCEECNKSFSSSSGLKQHMQIHFDKKFLCSECGKKFSTKNLLYSHMKTHSGVKPYSCSICSKTFAQKSSLNKHLLVHTGEKPISCNICGKRFSQQGHLTYHMRQHSGERPYSCTYCDKTFNHSGTFKVHTRIHTGEKPFGCHICSKRFYDSSSMKKHIKIHDNAEKHIKTETMEFIPQQQLMLNPNELSLWNENKDEDLKAC
ncbi:unnamed protein product [Phaedon cochleariae]|uniref:C2H2-type domain-containing protein n=1 Tax=Phaedon cochleariae TaxID=80249 RepID=A0A9N9X251_PHACE|nr:unnamed protein product [Phaedon cochleariae]